MRVLIVEDEKHTLRELKELVEEHEKNFVVTAISSAKEALMCCKYENFSIALLDIEMPITNGLELAAEIYLVLPKIKIAFVTAYNHYATEAFDAYAIDYVLKPVRKERLYKCLEKLALASELDMEDVKRQVSIRTFGKFEVVIDGEIAKWKRQKSYEVFAYLVMHYNKPVHKEKLMEDIFSEYGLAKATVQLHTAVSHIRKFGLKIDYFNNSYMFSACEGELDLYEFETSYKRIKSAQKNEGDMRQTIHDTLKIVTGDFFEEDGFSWSQIYSAHLKNQTRGLLKRYKEMQ